MAEKEVEGGMHEMQLISAQQAAAMTGVHKRLILAALNEGTLEGRNLKGRRGWVTSRGAVLRWVEGGNQKTEGGAF